MIAQLLRTTGVLAVAAGFAGVIGYCSSAPSYERFASQTALLTLSFSHATKRRAPCTRLTPAEIAALPPSERKPLDCPRERWPLVVELVLDGALVYAGDAEPAGIADDGVATVYESFALPAGHYQLTARLRDSGRATGFDHERSMDIELRPGQRFVVDFRIDQGGFIFGAHKP